MKEYIIEAYMESNTGSAAMGRTVAELIRCKDCKHYDGYYCHNKYWGDGYGNYTPPIKSKDGFCDWAERKETS